MKGITHISWRGAHKWLGLVMAFFLIMFCGSGLILNHREMVARYELSRRLLPPEYSIRNYNNGIVKGTVPMPGDTVLLFGNSGIWIGPGSLKEVEDFNAGLPERVDNRNVRNVIRTRTGELYCVVRSGLYRHGGGKEDKWIPVSLPGSSADVRDVTIMPDSLGVVVLTRSEVFVPDSMSAERGGEFRKVSLLPMEGQENKVTLFKTVWHLHSGQLFGLPGVLVVDALGVVMIFLSVTGIVVFFMPYSIRRTAAAKIRRRASVLKWNFKWHNKVGAFTIVLTLALAATGMCLRPPLMVPLVLGKTAPVPGSALDSDNVWHDRLRAIRWDSAGERWLLSTSEGFVTVDRDFSREPQTFGDAVMPPVSPMGVNVLEEAAPGQWLVGSFTGMYVWDMNAGRVHDYYTGKRYLERKPGPPVSDHLVTGYTDDLLPGQTVIFDYAAGAEGLAPMPSQLTEQPMSLWNVAQEVHTGRIYNCMFGPSSVLFIFLAGLSVLFVLISGWKLNRRRKKKSR